MKMKNRFTIGQAAKINDIPVKTLRYYDEIGLLKPQFTDHETGYRYYSHEQFFAIDTIKFMKSLGLPLAQIKRTLQMDGVSMQATIELLTRQQQLAAAQLRMQLNRMRSLRSSIENLRFLEEHLERGEPYRRSFPKRYIAAISEQQKDIYQLDLSLKELLLDARLLPYKTYQYGSQLDMKAFLKGELQYNLEYMQLNRKPDFPCKQFYELPAGEGICFLRRIYVPDEDYTQIIDYIHANHLENATLYTQEMNFFADSSQIISELSIHIGR